MIKKYTRDQKLVFKIKISKKYTKTETVRTSSIKTLKTFLNYI